MSQVEPINAIFGLVGGIAFGLTGIAVGPVVTPLFLLLCLGINATAG